MRTYITQEHIKSARDRKLAEDLFGPLGLYNVRDKYAREKMDGSQEDWYDICARVVNGNCSLVEDRFIEPGEPQKLYELMVTMQILPAGRHLWATGIGDDRQFINNCFVADFTEEFHKHFTYTFMRLMEGGGVGANYSDRFIHSNPNHPQGHWIPDTAVEIHAVCRPDHPDYEFPVDKSYGLSEEKFCDLLSKRYSHQFPGANGGFITDPEDGVPVRYLQVEDSREGWAEALEMVLKLAFSGKGLVRFMVDVSRVREHGAKIKKFGGKASGPTALVVMLNKVAQLLADRVGQKLSGLDMMTLDHYIAQAVIAGGTRRSARMAMKHWLDEDIFEFIHCKSDYRLHWTTNISVVVDDEFFRALRFKRHPHHKWANDVLSHVVDGMMENGEPGMINASTCEADEPVGAQFFSTNPCVTDDTLILTEEGMATVRELIGKPFVTYYSGKAYRSDGFFSTGIKPVFRVETEQGTVLRATADHKLLVSTAEGEVWKTVEELQWGDHVVLRGEWSPVLESHYRQLAQRVEKSSTTNADGEIIMELHNGLRILDDAEAQQQKIWLNMMGIPSWIHYNRGTKSWWIHIDRKAYHQLGKYLQVVASGKKPTLKAPVWTEQVKTIAVEGEFEVYDCQVPGIHKYISNGLVSHNCGEIPMMRYPDMKSFDVCCLGHVNLAFAEDPTECFRLMTRFLIRATFANLPDPLTRENVVRNRRIGVGFLGFHEWLVKQGIRFSEAADTHGSKSVAKQLAKFREVVEEAARYYAYQLRIPEPVKKTTLAPTGTISTIPGVTSGIQPLYAPFYIRRIRYQNTSEELQRILESGEYLHVEPAINEPNTTVVEFACEDAMVQRVADHFVNTKGIGMEEARELAISLIESQLQLSVEDFLKVQEMVQREYADNAVSITINANPEVVTADRLKELLKNYMPRLKGITLYFERTRPQSPFEAISYQAYLAAKNRSVSTYEEQCVNACPVV